MTPDVLEAVSAPHPSDPMTNPEPNPSPAIPVVANEDRTVAIVSYLTFIGLIVAIVIHGNRKTALGAYHLRQALGLTICAIVMWVVATVLAFIPIIGWLIMLVVWIGLFILWLMGLIAAASGQMKPVPVLGDNFQKWFAGAFA